MNDSREPGKIILINGASSAGKSTLARSLQQKLHEPFLHWSFDHLRESHALPMARIRNGELDWALMRPAIFDGFHRSLPAFAKAGNNLIVFPEGTRTPRNGDIRFKRGAANIAVRGKCNLIPVVIRCTPSTLGKGDTWWKVPPRRVQLTIEVQEEIDIQTFLSAAENETLAARHLNEHLQQYFAEENKRHAVA